ncbi:hypothetical protein [Desulfosporosinus fructosivorans]|nr:hypothetical protein [Desulfosporosinus fructosivorans]
MPFWRRVIEACLTRLCLKGSLCKITPSGFEGVILGGCEFAALTLGAVASMLDNSARTAKPLGFLHGCSE